MDGLFGGLGLTASARGNVIAQGAVQPFAMGGLPDGALDMAGLTGDVMALPALKAVRDQVVDRPIVFPMARGIGLAAEAGPEAILPLVGGGIRALGPEGETVLPLARAASGHLAVRLDDETRAAAGATAQPFALGGLPDGAIDVAGLTGDVMALPSLKAVRDQIVDRPIVFPMAKGVGLAAEAGPEAIMPLVGGGIRALGPEGETVLPLARAASGHLAVRLDGPARAAAAAAVQPFALGGVPSWARVPEAPGAARPDQASRSAAASGFGGLRVEVRNFGAARGEEVRVEEGRDGDGDFVRLIIDRVAGTLSDDVDRNRGALPAAMARAPYGPRTRFRVCAIGRRPGPWAETQAGVARPVVWRIREDTGLEVLWAKRATDVAWANLTDTLWTALLEEDA